MSEATVREWTYRHGSRPLHALRIVAARCEAFPQLTREFGRYQRGDATLAGLFARLLRAELRTTQKRRGRTAQRVLDQRRAPERVVSLRIGR